MEPARREPAMVDSRRDDSVDLRGKRLSRSGSSGPNRNLFPRTQRNLAKITEFNRAAATRGSALATGKTKEETADEKWEREAKIRYAGTGMDPTT